MVYAVAMSTIRNFERALGRRALWSPRLGRGPREAHVRREFVQRLRIYPHALREANAYYSPEKKALLFGYFPAPAGPEANLPGGTVFTCLSHDIIAHESTHALLDGMHRHFIEPSNPDVLAFHEAFADIVALFQHFSLRGAAPPDRRDARRPREPEPARRAGAAVRPGDRQPRRAARRHRRSRPGDRQVGATDARPGDYQRDAPSRTTAARSWWPPCSTPS